MKFNIGDRVMFGDEVGTVRVIIPSTITNYPYRVSLDSWLDEDYLFLCKESELELIE